MTLSTIVSQPSLNMPCLVGSFDWTDLSSWEKIIHVLSILLMHIAKQ